MWFRHRDRLMQSFGVRGRRPLAWWAYEAKDLRWPGHDREQSTLYEAGVLAEAERVELETFWRQEFARASAPDFVHCAGQGKFLHGAAARRAHFKWADIPKGLIGTWREERRRSAHTIRELQLEADRNV
jgi:hypothetical protein